ncbi:MAG: helix-turn-helix domain-containing protein [Chloroflexota bacterium]|nr:helix-turn-helix domain-containing protein [Chloroflexota bacterium]
MRDMRSDLAWTALPNPFLTMTHTFEVGHVSGRIEDIVEIVTSGQSAIILTGAPNIGKTALIRYLQLPPEAPWSWRNELADFRSQLNLDEFHFLALDLASLKESTQPGEQLNTFLRECSQAIYAAYRRRGQSEEQAMLEPDLKGLRKLLRTIRNETSHARYFVILEAIDRLAEPDIEEKLTPQDRGLALLDRCRAIRTLVDLIDEFSIFGAMIVVENLPRPDSMHQFSHVSPHLSADLARFRTMSLQAFTWDDAEAFLAQEPGQFGADWAQKFKALGGEHIFSPEEQRWLLNQAGTHPYLLEQFCFLAFRLKNARRDWGALQEPDKRQLIEKVNELLSTYLANTWKRLQEALHKSSPEAENKFRDFIGLLSQDTRTEDILDPADWERLGPELRYILRSEGILRYDIVPRAIHYPGTILSQYLVQKAREVDEQPETQQASSSISGPRFSLMITRPGTAEERMPVSELEYHLLKTLLQYPQRCTAEQLMKGAWNKIIERSTFNQRMHHLRKKLKEHFGGQEIIENRYGGQYSLKHVAWFRVEP